jgi:hypothetical protein
MSGIESFDQIYNGFGGIFAPLLDEKMESISFRWSSGAA